MQVRATLTRRYRVNGVMTLAFGIALLAALILGGVALNSRTELPVIGNADANIAQPATNRLAEMAFIEQNVWDVERAPGTTAKAIRFSETNSFDYVAARETTSIAGTRFLEENSFDYVVPMSRAEIAFIEANSWDYAPQAQFAAEMPDGSGTPGFRFVEENRWGAASVLPSGDLGQRDY